LLYVCNSNMLCWCTVVKCVLIASPGFVKVCFHKYIFLFLFIQITHTSWADLNILIAFLCVFFLLVELLGSGYSWMSWKFVKNFPYRQRYHIWGSFIEIEVIFLVFEFNFWVFFYHEQDRNRISTGIICQIAVIALTLNLRGQRTSKNLKFVGIFCWCFDVPERLHTGYVYIELFWIKCNTFLGLQYRWRVQVHQK